MDLHERHLPEEHPEALLVTIDLTAEGRVVRWTVSHLDGEELEDWCLEGQFLDAISSFTWTVDWSTYQVVRDILRFINESDWEPGTFF